MWIFALDCFGMALVLLLKWIFEEYEVNLRDVHSNNPATPAQFQENFDANPERNEENLDDASDNSGSRSVFSLTDWFLLFFEVFSNLSFVLDTF